MGKPAAGMGLPHHTLQFSQRWGGDWMAGVRGTAGTASGWAWTRWWPDRTLPSLRVSWDPNPPPLQSLRHAGWWEVSVENFQVAPVPLEAAAGPCLEPACPHGKREDQRGAPTPAPNGSLALSTILPPFSQNGQITSSPQRTRGGACLTGMQPGTGGDPLRLPVSRQTSCRKAVMTVLARL